MIKLPIVECQEYFSTHSVQLFRWKKIKTVQGKHKIDQIDNNDAVGREDGDLDEQIAPYDIYLVVTDIAVFTTIDLKDSPEAQDMMYIDSRYTLYDLVKITSRKNSASMITFYFRIPKFKEYNAKLEENFLESIDKKPAPNYMFAHKRKNYVEVCWVCKFDSPEIAHEWIKKVSWLYKILKHTETSKELAARQTE